MEGAHDVERKLSERYLNLVTIHIGEALARLGELRQRGAKVGDDELILVAASLEKASFALRGEVWVPVVDPKHHDG